MKDRWQRFDVLLALVTVGLLSGAGDPATRLVDVSSLLVFWAVYFSGAAGMRMFYNRQLRPAYSRS
jgi:hypothetical protein